MNVRAGEEDKIVGRKVTLGRGSDKKTIRLV